MLCYTQCRSLDDPFFCPVMILVVQFVVNIEQIGVCFGRTHEQLEANGTTERERWQSLQPVTKYCVQNHITRSCLHCFHYHWKPQDCFAEVLHERAQRRERDTEELISIDNSAEKIMELPIQRGRGEHNLLISVWHLVEEKKLNGWISFVVDMDQPKMGIFQAT